MPNSEETSCNIDKRKINYLNERTVVIANQKLSKQINARFDPICS